jgi:uncharacterized protein YecE (DUF72 family)
LSGISPFVYQTFAIRRGIDRRASPADRRAAPLAAEEQGNGMMRIGISGWLYPAWRGTFYPKGLPQRRELGYASRAFNSIEINGTFYSLKSPDSFQAWRDETPDDFVFALKGARFITHMKQLLDCETALANFFAQGVLALGHKLGPILWQLPARMPFHEERIERFLALLPRDTAGAARLARHRDRRIMAGRTLLEPAGAAPLRYALEARHESFRDRRFLALLRRAGVALVVSDAPDWPRFEEITADFLYLRLHGAHELYSSGYDSAAIDLWAERIRRWARGGPARKNRRLRDVYAYFDNDAKVRAPPDALALAARLGVNPSAAAPARAALPAESRIM